MCQALVLRFANAHIQCKHKKKHLLLHLGSAGVLVPTTVLVHKPPGWRLQAIGKVEATPCLRQMFVSIWLCSQVFVSLLCLYTAVRVSSYCCLYAAIMDRYTCLSQQVKRGLTNSRFSWCAAAVLCRSRPAAMSVGESSFLMYLS